MKAPLDPPRVLALSSLRGPILLSYLYQSCVFALVALPVLDATRASGISQFPEPARLLSSEGSLWWLELLSQQKSSLSASLGTGMWLFAGACCLALVPEWWLLRAIVRQLTGAAEPAGRVLARLSGLGLVCWLLRLLVWLAAAALASLGPRLTALSDERSADLVLLGVVGLSLLLELGLSLLRDLAALGVVSGERSALAALLEARQWGLARSARLTAHYAALRALSFGTWLGGELLLFALPSATTAHAGVGFAVHQLALLARSVLHAAWLRWLARQLAA